MRNGDLAMSQASPGEAVVKRRLFVIAGVLAVFGAIGAAAGGALYYVYPVQVSILAGLTRNYLISWFAPAGTATTEANAAYKGDPTVAAASPVEVVASVSAAQAPSTRAAAGDWPSYNRTHASERYSPLNEINTKNVGRLKVQCTYDVGEFAAFESGLIMVDNALIGTTEFDIFSINPATCAQNWRTHEEYPPSLLPANRAPPTWMACCFAAPRTGGCWPMTSRPASESGRRESRTRSAASRCRRRRLPGTASCSSAMR